MSAAAPALWPFAALRVRAGEVELRTPTDDDLPALAALYPLDVPFDPTLPVSSGDAGHRARESVLRHVWRARAELTPVRWRLCFAVYVGGVLVGQQDLKAVDFPARRIVESSSWAGTSFRGRGYGKTMRALVLHLAFRGFGARAAESESTEGNDAALGVTRSLGYDPCGDRYALAGSVVEHRMWSRLTKERWSLIHQGYGTGPVTVEGLEACLPLLAIERPAQ